MSIVIDVLAGRNLAPKDKTGKSDPYVVAKLFGIKSKVKKKKTNFVKQDLNPVWNETFSFQVNDLRIQAIHFVVWDKDTFGSDFMGQVTVTLKEVAQAGNTLDDWFSLDTNAKGEAVSGDIHIKLTLTPPEGQEALFGPEATAARSTDEVEDDLTEEQIQQVVAEEDEFNKGKTELTDCYNIGKELGRGAFAVVKVATHKKSGRRYAVKIIDRLNMGENHEVSLEREIDIMRQVDHPNVIRLRQVFQDKKNVNLVMELVTGGELFDKIVEKGNYSEKDSALLVHKMVEAMKYLHALGIAHRDLKPENLLLKTKDTLTDVKIADFGLSRIVNESAIMRTACGTPTYVAPEVLQNTGYGPEVDMWSIGVIAYILLCGFPPFFGDTVPEMFEQIMAGSFDFPAEYWGDVSKEAKDFISKLLVVSQKDRLSAVKALEHPWLKNAAAASAKPLASQFSRRLQSTVYNRRQETSSAIGADF